MRRTFAPILAQTYVVLERFEKRVKNIVSMFFTVVFLIHAINSETLKSRTVKFKFPSSHVHSLILYL